MESDNRNAPAFSQHPGIQIDGPPTDWLGLTKREWFAGQLMPSIIAATSAGQHFPTKAEGDTHIVQAIARDAVQAADALISALETKT